MRIRLSRIGLAAAALVAITAITGQPAASLMADTPVTGPTTPDTGDHTGWG